MYEWVTDIPPAYAPGAMAGAYAILLLMGAAFTAVGCLASALTSSQIVAGLLTILFLLIQFFLGYVTVIWGESFRAAPMFHYISSQEHLHYFTRGLLDTRPVVYYLSVTVFMLFITYQIIDYRRWRR
jgi:ABC-2 type transport system permease protein